MVATATALALSWRDVPLFLASERLTTIRLAAVSALGSKFAMATGILQLRSLGDGLRCSPLWMDAGFTFDRWDSIDKIVLRSNNLSF